ncbi:MAG: universal stress protein [Candidatus Thermoplasmatota archaeon]
MGIVLVDYDPSKIGEKVITNAVSMLKESDTLIVLFVLPKAKEELDILPPDITVSQAREMINGIIGELKVKGIDALGIVRVGDIADEILRIAEEMNCTLIVLGDKLTKVERFALGNIADIVKKNAKVPVLVVK